MTHCKSKHFGFLRGIHTKSVAPLLGILAVVACVGFAVAILKPPSPPNLFEEVGEDPRLPRVLIIGDSISIDYTVPVREQLRGMANVQRADTNCESTRHGLQLLDQWLGNKPWDVIHFNFGLHDLKYMDEKGDLVVDPKEGIRQVPLDQYEKNLEKIVGRLKKTDAVLIWRTTTPIPPAADGRIAGDAAKYNEVALEVMKRNDILVHDLYAFCLPKIDAIQLHENVHFTPEGSALLAKEVAKQIKNALQTKSETHTKPISLSDSTTIPERDHF